MSIQLSLLKDERIKKTLINVPIEQLAISELNPRSTRPDDDINKLATRIAQNGFEITRALWVYQNGTGYEVFAGGSRLEAAKRAGCKDVPVVLHEDLTDEDTVRLAYEDNENDDYHTALSVVDVWENYAKLRERKWGQERIAGAVGVSQAMVSYRLDLHQMPDKIKKFISQGLLTEGHLTEVMKLSVDLYFSAWLTTPQAHLELAEKAVHDRGKNGKKSVRAVKKDVDTWKEFVNYAEQVFKSLAEEMTLYDFDTGEPTPYIFRPKDEFVEQLETRAARTLVKVKMAEHAVRSLIADNLRQYQHYIEQQSEVAAREAMKAEKEAALLSRFILGDCLPILDNWQMGKIKLLLTDPPYGKSYQSNRRWASPSPKKIEGDNEGAIPLLGQMLEKVYPHLDDDAHILVFCDWKKEPLVREIIEQAGLKIKGSLIWVKEEHSAGDVKGSFGPSHERIIHAVKGSPGISPRNRDVLEATRTRETTHPNEKPTSLLSKLIQSTTNENDMILDPFAGGASTLIAAMKQGRDFVGIEIEQTYHEEGSGRLLKELS